ncbi:hypothetical protein KP509_16G040300 [Ceratopteris richardii]|uniref:Uncharacterized protein n=1 Tax=Ceratopteris richardii TaxID=49495 RepID=A0A8T2T062_CERRI|nr:hypothetical protein KP509_16G040300 [Ceratopteris richardii]
MGMEQKDEATVAHGENNVRVWRTAGPECKVIVEVHAPSRGLQLPGFVRLLELQGYSSFRFSTVCCSSNPHDSAYAKCLRAEVDARMSDLESSLFKQSIVNYFC